MADINTLIKQFARNNGLSELQEKDGRYTLYLDGNEIHCHGRNQQLWLEAEFNMTGTNDNINNLLASRSMSFIREQRACLSINEETNNYCLHQRIPMENLTSQYFQTELENFGGCYQYIQDIIQQAGGDNNPG